MLSLSVSSKYKTSKNKNGINHKKLKQIDEDRKTCKCLNVTCKVESEVKAKIIAGNKRYNALGHTLRKHTYNTH